MRAATQVHSRASWGDEYGYGIWVYPDRKPPIYEANGRGGQRVTVVPAANLVVVFAGGEFEPGDIGNLIGRSIKSEKQLPENPSGAAQLAKSIRDAARPPVAGSVGEQESISREISGKTYQLENNPVGLKSLSVSFTQGSEALIRLGFLDGRTEQRPVGLDGVPRLSANGRFGLPVALSGAWESARTFVLNYDEAANINSYHFRLTFSGDSVSVGLKEDTGLTDFKFNGHQ
jgi:hypothetical protein